MNNESLLQSIIQTQLDEVWVQNFSDYEEAPNTATVNTGAIFKPVESTHGIYIGRILAGTSQFDIVAEGAVIPSDTFRVEYQYSITALKFAKNIVLTKELYDDNFALGAPSPWSDVVANEAIVARQSQNKNAFKVFRLGFTTYLSADGVALFSASHPLIKGGTQSNLATGALSSTTLNNAMTLMRTMKNQAGVLMGNYARHLLVPAALWKTATEAVGSPLTFDSGQNALNVFRSAVGLDVYCSPFLDYDSLSGEGSNTAWFLLAANHSVRRWVRQGYQSQLVDWSISDNASYKYVVIFREEVFAIDYAGLVGSTGV